MADRDVMRMMSEGLDAIYKATDPLPQGLMQNQPRIDVEISIMTESAASDPSEWLTPIGSTVRDFEKITLSLLFQNTPLD
jgi:hypothetical protein